MSALILKRVLARHLLRPRTLHALAAIALVTSLASSVLSAPSRAASEVTEAPTIRVLAAWIRWLPAGLPTAGYLTLTNTGDKALALEGATSAAYGGVSIHRSIRHGTTEEMVPVKEITIEPHSTLDFESNGYHLMLMQPGPPTGGAKVPITLHFSGGSVMTVPFEVRRNAAAGD